MKNSFCNVLIGAERSGKSFYAKAVSKIYAQKRGSVLIYNFGKMEDFPNSEYYYIEPLTFKEHVQLIHSEPDAKRSYNLNKTIEYFRYGEQIIHFKDFSKYFWKRKVKMYKISNKTEETEFFKSVYKYLSRTLLVLDDCKTVFRYGLNDGHDQLFSRKNHCGVHNSVEKLRGLGNDIICIFHNVDHVNTSLWDFTTAATIFKFPMKPHFKKMNNDFIQNLMEKARTYLETAPQYTALQINIQGENAGKITDVTLKT